MSFFLNWHCNHIDIAIAIDIDIDIEIDIEILNLHVRNSWYRNDRWAI